MDASEVVWRTGTAARIAAGRAAAAIRTPRWDRRRLAAALEPSVAPPEALAALRARRWNDAHTALSKHFATAPRRFPISPRDRRALVERIRTAFPHAAAAAATRARRITSGEYDLLGYKGLRFGAETLPDWHVDPVHERRAPLAFWSRVPFLDPACGDHKVIWELNRQQHWLALGRAWWLADRREARNRFIAELESWLAANPPLTGINWASMLELAFRSLSLLSALQFFVDPDGDDDTPWLVDLLLALDRQLTHVERHLSHYFSPNTHLLGEALALYVAGRALPELAASGRREAVGRQILLAQIEQQIAADGGHCERSAHYHRYTLDFYLLALIVARLTHDAAAAQFERAAARLAFAARLLADDAGRLPHIGDDDGGALFPIAGRAVDDVRDSLAVAAALVNRPDLQIGTAPEEACWLLAGLEGTAGFGRTPPQSGDRVRSASLPDMGYYVSRTADGTQLVVDAGPHGFQNGGHAHADALSLTLTVRRTPLLIDPGTACYTVDCELRDRMRSSALHNTVTVDGKPQSVPRGPFHWMRVANGTAHRWRTNDGFDYFDGSHDGYAPVVHRRRVLALQSGLVVVADLVDGEGPHHVDAHWHIDPRWSVQLNGRQAICTADGEQTTLWIPQGRLSMFSGDRSRGLGWHSPVYGVVEPATTLEISHDGPPPLWLATIIDLSDESAVKNVETLPVWTHAGTLAHAFAVRITRTSGVDLVLFAEPSSAAAPDETWRVGDFETDARMLFVRLAADGAAGRVAIADGSFVRRSGRRGLQLELARTVPDFHLDLTGEPRAAGPAFGARLTLGGVNHPLDDVDRRATPGT